jgi:hypothetical protein
MDSLHSFVQGVIKGANATWLFCPNHGCMEIVAWHDRILGQSQISMKG